MPRHTSLLQRTINSSWKQDCVGVCFAQGRVSSNKCTATTSDEQQENTLKDFENTAKPTKPHCALKSKLEGILS